ncbi:hypothetical protein BC659_1290 [Sediminibacterium goheungense]|uniref:DUF4468 domain-containing protein n=2 Tax=Sediminibacterium goheungense TaxID=1086393 RepID=A0A4R6J2Q7_9BACT|nr:hypothetical protein BC659_1290 [Sediminibacterium goheungense]
MAQLHFPVDENSGKVQYQLSEDIAVSNTDKYNRTKTWFMNYYKTSRFEEYFMSSKRGRLTHLEESKKSNSISGKYGFHVMYPSETSSMVIEQVFVMFTMKITFTKTGYENLITDMICFTAPTNSNGNMRPVEFGLEAYNAQQLNRLGYVQYYIIPQVNQSVKKIQQDLSRSLRYGNLTEISW